MTSWAMCDEAGNETQRNQMVMRPELLRVWHRISVLLRTCCDCSLLTAIHEYLTESNLTTKRKKVPIVTRRPGKKRALVWHTRSGEGEEALSQSARCNVSDFGLAQKVAPRDIESRDS